MEMELGNLAGDRNGAALLGMGLRQEREDSPFSGASGCSQVACGRREDAGGQSPAAFPWDWTLNPQVLPDLGKGGGRRGEGRRGRRKLLATCSGPVAMLGFKEIVGNTG